MSFTFEDLARDASAVVTALQPVVAAASPAAATAVGVGARIVQGALALEPAAVALVQQMASGALPTADQIKAFESDYEAAYEQLRVDLAAKGAN